ncbi:hypothetical protein WICPIJ_000666 [Wickerhamomyces pijperi]|uniref:Uncharacterized protein n=1 Tax=Wickerhamomyces pijperi TaxID=599730 RepID=A0A9P8QFF7_WICPI|nr:hypothetical protein WICPIJ_000666 [Wickerhamomyces pijperi]
MNITILLTTPLNPFNIPFISDNITSLSYCVSRNIAMFIVGTLKVCECSVVGFCCCPFVDDSMPFIAEVEECTAPAIAETDLKPVATPAPPLVFPPLTLALALALPPLTGAGGALIVGFLLSKTGGFSVSGVMVIGTFETLTPNWFTFSSFCCCCCCC